MGRLSSHRSELEKLKRELGELRRELRPQASEEPKPQKVVEPTESKEEAPELVVEKTPPPQPGAAPEEEVVATPEPEKVAEPAPIPAAAMQSPAKEEAAPSKESQDWFSKVAIWVGSIALLMAGFYLVKYSIDSGLLTPAVRLWLTTGFGVLLCGAGLIIGIKSERLANERIGQGLSGAGVACLYFAAYAAVHMYGFLTAGQGFGAMLAVTVLAVGLSLKNGAPVAMLGLVGGFLTPWLMSTGSNDTVMLFSYLFILFCGAQFLCLRRGWWSLLLVSLLGAYLWSAIVIAGHISGAIDQVEGTLLFDSHNTSREIYTYSVVWLVLAILYQAIGLIRNQSAIHVGSLILLLITVGKVFLVDASELEGLFRVLSFLGLGLALIGIGYFYNKVVFARRDRAEGRG